MSACRGELGCAAIAAALALVGCAVGPDYTTPELPLPDAWRGRDAAAPTAPTDLAVWWRSFGDPTLDALIEAGIAQNLDLKTAAARIREARAERAMRTAGFFPAVGANGDYQYTRPFSLNSQLGSITSASPVLPSGFPTEHLYQAGFDADWEIDVFGGVRRGVEAADADLAAAIDDARDVQVTLLAEIARDYVEVRALERRIVIADENVASQRDSVALTEDRFASGLSSELDVRQARSLLATTEAEIPALASQREQLVHALGVLLGQEPNALADELARRAPIPGAADPEAIAVHIPVGLPADLLRRRPDIRSAERQLAAATARIGVATAELYPKFSVAAFSGLQSISTADFFTSGSRYFGIGPAMRWRLFEGGRVRAGIEAEDARTEQVLHGYQQAILTGLQNVEDALVAYRQERVRHAALVDAVSQTRRAVELARDLYVSGLGAYLAVLDAQRAQYQAEDALAQSDQALVTELIALYKALGGGWEAP